MRFNHGMRNRNQVFFQGDQTDERKIFTGSTTPPAPDKIFVARMLTRDLFAVANVLLISCTSTA